MGGVVKNILLFVGYFAILLLQIKDRWPSG